MGLAFLCFLSVAAIDQQKSHSDTPLLCSKSSIPAFWCSLADSTASAFHGPDTCCRRSLSGDVTTPLAPRGLRPEMPAPVTSKQPQLRGRGCSHCNEPLYKFTNEYYIVAFIQTLYPLLSLLARNA